MSIFDRLKKQTPDAAAKTDAKQGAKKPAAKKTEKSSAKKQSTATSAVAAPANGKTIIMRPLVTEKATLSGTYAFVVASSANKSEIAKAVEAQYGVKPKHVRVMNYLGKTLNWNYRKGKRRDWKKAIVTLPAGKTINVYEAE